MSWDEISSPGAMLLAGWREQEALVAENLSAELHSGSVLWTVQRGQRQDDKAALPAVLQSLGDGGDDWIKLGPL